MESIGALARWEAGERRERQALAAGRNRSEAALYADRLASAFAFTASRLAESPRSRFVGDRRGEAVGHHSHGVPVARREALWKRLDAWLAAFSSSALGG